MAALLRDVSGTVTKTRKQIYVLNVLMYAGAVRSRRAPPKKLEKI
jgi:hypothetical protein